MSDQNRRTFLKRAAGAVPAAAAVSALGVEGCAPEGNDSTEPLAGATLPAAPLRAVADVALPQNALGQNGTAAAVAGFTAWVEGFEPAAELDHPYLTGELRYGLPHPGPRWAAQLEAMDLESERRSGIPLAELSADERRRILATALGGDSTPNLPRNPAQADHVAVGLLAWFYGTSKANDLCYEAQVLRHECRGTESLPAEPAPVEDA